MISLILSSVAIITWIISKTKGILWGRDRTENEPPIVPGHFLLGNGKEFDEDSVGFILRSQKKYGDIFTIRMLHYYMTVITDPHSFEAFSKERSFDFDPIQKQVNGNIFNFQIPQSRSMIKFVGSTTRGSSIPRSLHQFSGLLDSAYAEVPETVSWQESGLDSFANQTLFQAIFNSIFGADKETPEFNYDVFHDNFKVFHKYFSYFWIGLPHFLFPEATKAVGKCLAQPTPQEFMESELTSDYLKAAIQYLQSYGLSDSEVKSHNLVFMHININTFKIAVWCLYKLMEHKEAMAAVREEIDNLIANSRDEEGAPVYISPKEMEAMETIDSLVQETFRLSSGVFMIRHNQKDVDFQVSEQNYRIRAGDKIMIYPAAIHKDPEIFEKPEEFQYDRFIGKTHYKNGTAIKNPVIAFGSICPGRKLALLQVKWFLITLLNRFDLELLPGESCDFDMNYPGHEIVPPTNDVRMQYKSRDGHADIRIQGC